MIWRLKRKTENSNKKMYMKEELINNEELIVIPDECGDTMWDAVLRQQENKCGVKDVSKTTSVLLNGVNAVKEFNPQQTNCTKS
jgi:hypothetical protein